MTSNYYTGERMDDNMDIVDKLRYAMMISPDEARAAADEIERLRLEVDKWKKHAAAMELEHITALREMFRSG